LEETLKTKALTVNSSAIAAKTALQHVELSVQPAAPISEREQFYMDLGEVKGHLVHSTLSNLLLAERLRGIKGAGAYKKAGYTWADVCDVFNISVDTADRLIGDLREFGALFFKTQAITRISREAFRLVAPIETEDGKILIGDQSFALTKANAQSIQAAIQLQKQRVESLQERTNSAEKSLKTAREERDNAKKAATDATRKLREAQTSRPFADVDEDHQEILCVQQDFDGVLKRFSCLIGPEDSRKPFSEVNAAHLIGLVEYIYRGVIQMSYEARLVHGRGLNRPDQGDAFLLGDEADSPNPIIEYINRKKDAKS
jgi:hypothetical protein